AKRQRHLGVRLPVAYRPLAARQAEQADDWRCNSNEPRTLRDAVTRIREPGSARPALHVTELAIAPSAVRPSTRRTRRVDVAGPGRGRGSRAALGEGGRC